MRDFDDAEVEPTRFLMRSMRLFWGRYRWKLHHDKSLRERQRCEIIRYIDQHLPDPTLSVSQHRTCTEFPNAICTGCSEISQITVNELIILKRLAGCERSLQPGWLRIFRLVRSLMPGGF